MIQIVHPELTIRYISIVVLPIFFWPSKNHIFLIVCSPRSILILKYRRVFLGWKIVRYFCANVNIFNIFCTILACMKSSLSAGQRWPLFMWGFILLDENIAVINTHHSLMSSSIFFRFCIRVYRLCLAGIVDWRDSFWNSVSEWLSINELPNSDDSAINLLFEDRHTYFPLLHESDCIRVSQQFLHYCSC